MVFSLLMSIQPRAFIVYVLPVFGKNSFLNSFLLQVVRPRRLVQGNIFGYKKSDDLTLNELHTSCTMQPYCVI